MSWVIELADEFEPEFYALHEGVQTEILAQSQVLQYFGPHIGQAPMNVNVDEIIARLDPGQRRKVEERAAELIAEEMSLRELRKARHLTQARVARQLGITQDGVSRLEQRSDVLLSTLRKTVEAMGGSLTLVARFPDRAPVELTGLAESPSRD